MREELLRLLSEAAEFEHGVCCAYLYAGFSIKRLPHEGLGWAQLEQNRSWAATLLTISREEMGHLATVSNLSVAVGGAPHYEHPAFPYSSAGCRLDLRPFSLPAVESMIELESSERRAYASADPKRGVGHLYGQIRDMLGKADNSLVIRPPDGQLAIDVPSTLRIARIGDVAAAIRAIDSIVEDGDTGPGSHRHRLGTIRAELTETLDRTGPEKTPPLARPVVTNPCWRLDAAAVTGDGRVTDSGSSLVMRLFDSAYHAMLLVLSRVAMPCGESPAQLSFLSSIAYYPLMTMVLRPLGEMATTLPSGTPGLTAGAAFNTGPLRLPPDRTTAWLRLQDNFDELATLGREVEASGVLGDRGRYLSQTLAALAGRLVAAAESQGGNSCLR